MYTHVNYPNIKFNHIEGKFYRIDNDKLLKIDDEGYLLYRYNINERLLKRKAINVAWEFMYEKIPEKKIIFPKDFNYKNCSGYNLICVSKKVFQTITDAYRNVNGEIKLIPHKTDMYSYVVKYRKNGTTSTIKYHDIVQALKTRDKLLLKSMKILGKYIISS